MLYVSTTSSTSSFAFHLSSMATFIFWKEEFFLTGRCQRLHYPCVIAREYTCFILTMATLLQRYLLVLVKLLASWCQRAPWPTPENLTREFRRRLHVVNKFGLQNAFEWSSSLPLRKASLLIFLSIASYSSSLFKIFSSASLFRTAQRRLQDIHRRYPNWIQSASNVSFHFPITKVLTLSYGLALANDTSICSSSLMHSRDMFYIDDEGGARLAPSAWSASRAKKKDNV